jgi:hypothetical protein
MLQCGGPLRHEVAVLQSMCAKGSTQTMQRIHSMLMLVPSEGACSSALSCAVCMYDVPYHAAEVQKNSRISALDAK